MTRGRLLARHFRVEEFHLQSSAGLSWRSGCPELLLLLTGSNYNIIVVFMIPDHINLDGSPWPVLPAGIHIATLAEVEDRFAFNHKRRVQFQGFVAALTNLYGAGCRRAFLDGSFVTAKPRPGDFDACWEPTGVNPVNLDPVLLSFENNRAAQKAKYYGELFPSTIPADRAGRIFVEFFQIDCFTGAPKGIISIDLSDEPMIQLKVTS